MAAKIQSSDPRRLGGLLLAAPIRRREDRYVSYGGIDRAEYCLTISESLADGLVSKLPWDGRRELQALDRFFVNNWCRRGQLIAALAEGSTEVGRRRVRAKLQAEVTSGRVDEIG